MKRTPNLTTLGLWLRDLTEKRHADLVKSKAGKFYEPQLREQLAALAALPPAVVSGRPLAEQLAQADAEHDGYGATMLATTEMVARLPGSPADLVDAASRIRAAFIPAAVELKDAYADEARRAGERRPMLKSLKADLQKFPVPGGGTLHDVATRYIEAGEKLNTLLSERGDIPTDARKDAGRIRSETLGMANRLRAELVREVSRTPSLPQDLEQRLFGYLDTLTSMQPAPAKPEDEPVVPPPAPPAPPAPPNP